MNKFDAERFRADYEQWLATDDGKVNVRAFRARHASPIGAYLAARQESSGRWQVRRKWIGWTVIDPEGRIHLTTGTSRSEWATATHYAHHAAEAHT